MKGGIDYNGYIATGRNNRKPSEVSKKNQRTDKKRGSSQARHEAVRTSIGTGRKGLTLGEAIKYADTYNVSLDYIAGRKKVEY